MGKKSKNNSAKNINTCNHSGSHVPSLRKALSKSVDFKGCRYCANEGYSKPKEEEMENPLEFFACLRCCSITCRRHTRSHHRAPRSDIHCHFMSLTNSSPLCVACTVPVDMTENHSVQSAINVVQQYLKKNKSTLLCVQEEDDEDWRAKAIRKAQSEFPSTEEGDENVRESEEGNGDTQRQEVKRNNRKLLSVREEGEDWRAKAMRKAHLEVSAKEDLSPKIRKNGDSEVSQKMNRLGNGPISDSLAGIPNLGSTCYMNSSLQSLASLRSVREIFANFFESDVPMVLLAKDAEKHIDVTLKREDDAFPETVAEVLYRIRSFESEWKDRGFTNGQTMRKRVEMLKSDFGHRFPEFSNNWAEQDSHEFLRRFLDLLGESVKKRCLEVCKEKDLGSSKSASSVIESMFKSTLLCVKHCEKCDHYSTNMDETLDLCVTMDKDIGGITTQRVNGAGAEVKKPMQLSKHKLKKAKKEKRKNKNNKWRHTSASSSPALPAAPEKGDAGRSDDSDGGDGDKEDDESSITGFSDSNRNELREERERETSSCEDSNVYDLFGITPSREDGDERKTLTSDDPTMLESSCEKGKGDSLKDSESLSDEMNVPPLFCDVTISHPSEDVGVSKASSEDETNYDIFVSQVSYSSDVEEVNLEELGASGSDQNFLKEWTSLNENADDMETETGFEKVTEDTINIENADPAPKSTVSRSQIPDDKVSSPVLSDVGGGCSDMDFETAALIQQLMLEDQMALNGEFNVPPLFSDVGEDNVQPLFHDVEIVFSNETKEMREDKTEESGREEEESENMAKKEEAEGTVKKEGETEETVEKEETADVDAKTADENEESSKMAAEAVEERTMKDEAKESSLAASGVDELPVAGNEPELSDKSYDSSDKATNDEAPEVDLDSAWAKLAAETLSSLGSSPSSLESLLMSDFRRTCIDDFKCPSCKGQGNTFSQPVLIDLPEVLMITMKRFRGVRGETRKIAAAVDFPAEMDLSPFTSRMTLGLAKGNRGRRYRLRAVIQHQGTARSGHYVAFVSVARHPRVSSGDGEETSVMQLKSGVTLTDLMEACKCGVDNFTVVDNAAEEAVSVDEEEDWYLVSDTTVRRSCLRDVLAAQAYILMYERK